MYCKPFDKFILPILLTKEKKEKWCGEGVDGWEPGDKKNNNTRDGGEHRLQLKCVYVVVIVIIINTVARQQQQRKKR